MNKLIRNFSLDSAIVSCERYGCGHINETYLIVTESGARYILQKINNNVFKNVKGLMAQPEIDGGLIGGASLKAADFSLVVNYDK